MEEKINLYKLITKNCDVFDNLIDIDDAINVMEIFVKQLLVLAAENATFKVYRLDDSPIDIDNIGSFKDYGVDYGDDYGDGFFEINANSILNTIKQIINKWIKE